MTAGILPHWPNHWSKLCARKNWENEGERNERLMNTRKKQKRRTKSSEADEVVFVIPAGVKHEEKKMTTTSELSLFIY